MENFEHYLDKYAELAIKVGINIQAGQTLIIMAPIASYKFVRKTAKKAYESGAKNVHIEWSDDQISLIKFQNAPDEAFKEFPAWRAKGLEEMAKEGAAYLSIYAPNPDLLKDIDPDRVAAANKTSAEALQGFNHYIKTSKISWALISVPTEEWAAKVYPELSTEQGMEKLWESIFMATRVDTENPVQAWKEHSDQLQNKVDYLNAQKFHKLHYQAAGTDLTVELPENHLWIGGGSINSKGTFFVPNLPTEEVFTLPLKEGVNGVVTSTKPLNYAGNLIDKFTLTFEKGRIVDFTAETGYESLKRLIETDEGAHYLGEIALVPHQSPISNLNVVFYNTLFDENASSHLAIGSAYPICLEEGADMSKEELEKQGANTSLVHVDFMIGSVEMNIDAETTDGKRVPLFRNGNWAE
jgi:aminopeptidase